MSGNSDKGRLVWRNLSRNPDPEWRSLRLGDGYPCGYVWITPGSFRYEVFGRDGNDSVVKGYSPNEWVARCEAENSLFDYIAIV